MLWTYSTFSSFSTTPATTIFKHSLTTTEYSEIICSFMKWASSFTKTLLTLVSVLNVCLIHWKKWFSNWNGQRFTVIIGKKWTIWWNLKLYFIINMAVHFICSTMTYTLSTLKQKHWLINAFLCRETHGHHIVYSMKMAQLFGESLTCLFMMVHFQDVHIHTENGESRHGCLNVLSTGCLEW